ncbi:unnamed protein product [Notodromas monacha]|uniref:Uncharacterized protein n=1 Tax=Notodromas monacha TaxID=399045 RepID=A0A7R9BKN9_9CRUS|nr:unnamed protein product [Notodromas monacha]CAG0917245.1 unnamed protein product [Notodromas monacha]
MFRSRQKQRVFVAIVGRRDTNVGVSQHLPLGFVNHKYFEFLSELLIHLFVLQLITPANTPATPPNFPDTLLALSKLSTSESGNGNFGYGSGISSRPPTLSSSPSGMDVSLHCPAPSGGSVFGDYHYQHHHHHGNFSFGSQAQAGFNYQPLDSSSAARSQQIPIQAQR